MVDNVLKLCGLFYAWWESFFFNSKLLDPMQLVIDYKLTTRRSTWRLDQMTSAMVFFGFHFE